MPFTVGLDVLCLDDCALGVDAKPILDPKFFYLLYHDLGVHHHSRSNEEPCAVIHETAGNHPEFERDSIIHDCMTRVGAYTSPCAHRDFIGDG